MIPSGRSVALPAILILLAGCGGPAAVCMTKRDCERGEECVSGECRSPLHRPVQPELEDGAIAVDGAIADAEARNVPDETDAGAEPSDCRLDLACGPGSVCDTNTGACVQIPAHCSSDPECTPPAFVCEQTQCVRGCAYPGGVQCTGATRCDPSTGRCAAATDFCTSDRDCTAPMVCNLLNGACEPGCTPSSCTAPATCDTASGRCTGPCASDSFEPNNSMAAARPAPSTVQPGLSICPRDDDFFSIPLTLNDALNIQVTAGIAEGDLDLELYAPDGSLVAGAHAIGGGEMMSYTAAASGAHTLRVYLVTDVGSVPGAEYALDVHVDLAPCADAFEPNESELAPASPAAGTSYPNLTVCSRQDDWYRFSLAANERIDVSLAFLDAEGDIDMSLLDDTELILASSLSTDDDEALTYVAPVAGDYFVHVFLYSDAGSQRGNTYTMSVSTSAGAPNNCNDAYEPNDDYFSASLIGIGSISGLGVCSDDDYYDLFLSAGDPLSVDVLFQQAEGDIDVVLLDSTDTVVASSAGIVSNEHLVYSVPSDDFYTLGVYLYGDAGSQTGNSYSLVVSY